jgi:hypothetical protein
MAEIRSTMELVMERAARMGSASSEEVAAEEQRKLGMQLSAEYLDERRDSLETALAEQPAAKQQAIRSGMVDALLHNVALQKDELAKTRLDRALQGLIALSGDAGDVRSFCQDLSKIGSQYGQHRTQLRQQLEDQIRMQYEQALMQQGRDPQSVRIDPTMQPKFLEEWSNIEEDLNQQYGRVLEQHKQLLRQRLGG